jgi:hypothetical protein
VGRGEAALKVDLQNLRSFAWLAISGIGNRMDRFGLLFALLMILCVPLFADYVEPKELPRGTSLESSDRRFTAFVDLGIKVRDNQTGQVSTAPTLPVVFFLKWASDSRTLMTVEHIAGGTAAGIVHYVDGSWKRSKVSAPDESEGFERGTIVTDITFHDGAVHLTYGGVSHPNGYSGPAHFYVYSFSVIPGSESQSDIVKREITWNAFRHLT